MTISQRIFSVMLQKKLSQADLARHLGIPASTVSAWKNNNSSPSSDFLVPIADFLGVSILELLGSDVKCNSSINDTLVTNNLLFERQDPFNNELVWKTYGHLSEKEKLQVQVYILDLAEKSEHSAAEVRVIEG